MLQPEDPMTLGDIIIRIDPPMRDVPMIDLLRIITESASAPLAFTIEDYAVVFCHPSRIRTPLVTRVFRIDLERMGPGLENLKRLDTTNSLARGMTPESLSLVQDRVRRLLTGSGVSLVPPNAVYFNDRQGLLMLRATEGEMKIVETAIQELNAGTRPWPEVPPEADAWPPEVSTNTAREFVTGLNSQLTDGPAPDSPAFGSNPSAAWRTATEIPEFPEDRHRPMLIAFEARWALDSQINRKVLESPRLRDLFGSTRAELYRVDCSEADTLSKTLQQRFAVKQVPGYAVYLPSRHKWTVVEGVLTPDMIAGLLESDSRKP